MALIGPLSDARSIAVDAQHIYWTNPTSRTIGRGNLDGTGVDQGFIWAYGAI
jgi:hypothetical protein